MKFLKKLLGQEPDAPPTWEVTPPELRPPPRARSAPPETESAPKAKPDNPFLDDAFGKFELEASEEDARDNPYSSQTWQVSHDDESRKLKALNIGCKTERPDPDDFNPYDTGVFKRGWK